MVTVATKLKYACSLKEKDTDTAITEDFIRKLVDDGRVKALTCGTKQLVAMESFICPKKLLGSYHLSYQGN